MGKQIKLPNIDFVKVGNTLVESGKTAGAFVKNHATEFVWVVKRTKKPLRKMLTNNSKLSENMKLKSMC